MAKSIRIHIESTDRKRQPFWLSVAKSAVFAAVLFGPGLVAGSAAMQWAGFAVMLTYCFVALVAASAEAMTIDEARKKLDEMEVAQ